MKSTWFILVAAIFSFSSMSFAEPLRLGGYDKPPYMTEDGGLCVDIFREAARRAGYDASYKLFPLKRMHQNFSVNRIDAEPCCTPAWRAKYKEISAYSDTYYHTENIVIVRKDSGIATTKNIRDFRGKTLGTILGYFITDGFQEEFEAGNIVRDDVHAQDQNIKKLFLKRVDGIIIDRATGLYLIKLLGFDPADFRIVYVFEIKSHLSIRIHKNREDVIPKLNKSLGEMKKDGTIDKIINKYIGTESKN
ncbi:MAG: transporter substrate-binding domain-containing protein [Desulfobacteraceae bacterium]|nr:transporter substrate-binding domain-containing protein [Desulfobacteraceae bacterium]